jgi:hypothetical protein
MIIQAIREADKINLSCHLYDPCIFGGQWMASYQEIVEFHKSRMAMNTKKLFAKTTRMLTPTKFRIFRPWKCPKMQLKFKLALILC